MRNYNFGLFEIMGEDLEITLPKSGSSRPFNKLTLVEVEEHASRMSGGWRLPTIKEMLFLQEYYNLRILNFSKEAYWVSDQKIGDEMLSENTGGAYYLSMGRYGGIPKYERIKARLVRSV